MKNDIRKCLANIVKVAKDKVSLTEDIVQLLEVNSFSTVEVNTKKPWGTYIRLDNHDAKRFMDVFFSGPRNGFVGELSPKFLIVEPDKRLSWQYHHRRSELWYFVTDGYYYRSDNDIPGEKKRALAGDSVRFQQGERHRLVGDDQVTIVAEIWQHTDPDNPSNENDIVRVQDDFQR